MQSARRLAPAFVLLALLGACESSKRSREARGPAPAQPQNAGPATTPEDPGSGSVVEAHASPEPRGAPDSLPDFTRPEWTRVASREGKYLVCWRSLSGTVPRNADFGLEVWVLKDGAPVRDAHLSVSGWMPEHGHGMSRQPRSESRPDGSYRVAGMLLHMRGHWQLFFDVLEGSLADTAESDLDLDTLPVFSEKERNTLLELSPLPAVPPDPTNAVYESEAAARLGQALFFDTHLSANGSVACATCHDPRKSWTDGKSLGSGISGLSRHTMTLWNVAYNRWFFWDGRKDSLWSQALGPLEDGREHGTSRLAILHLVADDPSYARAWREVFGSLPDLGDEHRFPREGRPVPGEPEHPHALAWAAMNPEDQETVTRAFANVGKAIAAFERKLVSRAAPFDRFVEGLRENDPEKVAVLDERAQHGAQLFVGKARCVLCHDGPTFTDGEFHDNRVFVVEKSADPGRRAGIQRLRADPFNTLGAYPDDDGEVGRIKLGLLAQDNHAGKQFKTPTLRNVARTAPYMHEGQLATLAEVVHFYSTLEKASPGYAGERIVQPLGLTTEEEADLVAFLESLTDESAPAELLGPPATPYVER